MMKENPLNSKSQRLLSLDALRGLVMILMAVDHANYFVARMHPNGEFWGIPLPKYDSVIAFLTRFVTQPCAPGFFFLMGAGMILFTRSRRKQGWSDTRISRHFMIRGFILVLLQFFAENSAWLLGPSTEFHPPGGGGQVWFHFGVLFALGMNMILGAFLIRLKPPLIFGISVSAIFLTQWIIPGPDQAERLFSPFLRMILIPGQTGPMQVFYSFFPWMGCLGFGLVFGSWLVRDERQAYRKALISGIVSLALFVGVRIAGGFGNFHPPESLVWMDLLHVTKYPPSLAFLFLTLGIVLVCLFLLSLPGKALKSWGKPLLVFGRSALVFYICHLYLFGIIGLFFAPRGTGIPLMYVFLVGGLLILYPICLWYGKFKRTKSQDSLWRFF
jgi:uncharacterized membrane protein